MAMEYRALDGCGRRTQLDREGLHLVICYRLAHSSIRDQTGVLTIWVPLIWLKLSSLVASWFVYARDAVGSIPERVRRRILLWLRVEELLVPQIPVPPMQN